MSLRTYPGRLLVVSAMSSLLLLGSSGVVATYLYLQQARTADILGENIGSRRAAANLEETLLDLQALHDKNAADVDALHERVAAHLSDILLFADKQDERDLAAAVARNFTTYRTLWDARNLFPIAGVLARTRLQAETLPDCKQLREYNSRQIDVSEQEHRRALRWMIFGLFAVGLLGSVAGLVLGYGLARGLRRAVNSLFVRIQGASDLLGQELATVQVERDGSQGDDDVTELVAKVERAVEKLQDREREVRRAERLAAVGQLAAGVAHEIRNPLTSVQLLVQTARRDPAAGGLDNDDLALIDGELGRIEQSLRSFLDYARPRKPEQGVCVLSAVVRDALGLVRAKAEQQGVCIRFSPTDVPITLTADAEQLRQVVLNLLLNALDAMPVGGTLDAAVRPAEGALELIVTDTGPGISAAVLPRLFEPFATSKETGLGLGLVVSQRIVEDHGGTIRGFNRPEGGACFAVWLPITTRMRGEG